MRSSPSPPRSAHRSRRTWRASSRRTAARSSARRRSPRSSPRRPTGAQLLDVRPVAAHLAGHRPGAINVPVSGTSFATKAGSCSTRRSPVCVLAETADEAQRAIRGLHSVAFFDIAGFVLGGGDEQHRRGHGRRARGADRRRRRGDRRAREGRPRHRLHPRQPQRPLPADGDAAAPTSRPTGRS